MFHISSYIYGNIILHIPLAMHVPYPPYIPYIYVAKLQYQVHIESTSSTYYSTFSTYSGGVCKKDIKGGRLHYIYYMLNSILST